MHAQHRECTQSQRTFLLSTGSHGGAGLEYLGRNRSLTLSMLPFSCGCPLACISTSGKMQEAKCIVRGVGLGACG